MLSELRYQSRHEAVWGNYSPWSVSFPKWAMRLCLGLTSNVSRESLEAGRCNLTWRVLCLDKCIVCWSWHRNHSWDVGYHTETSLDIVNTATCLSKVGLANLALQTRHACNARFLEYWPPTRLLGSSMSQNQISPSNIEKISSAWGFRALKVQNIVSQACSIRSPSRGSTAGSIFAWHRRGVKIRL